MAIRQLQIVSYKSIIKTVRLDLSPSLNIFIGQNNCGKTNILDAIDFACNPKKDPERLHHYRSHLTLTFDDNQKLFAEGYHVVAQPKAFRPQMKRILAEESWDFEQVAEDYRSLYDTWPKQYELLNSLFSQYFPAMASDRSMLDVDWQTGQLLVNEGDRTILLERLGSGFQKIFIILLYALHPAYPVVLLDEPETHLHPGLIKRLLKVLSTKATNQIILTTHSPLFVQPQTLFNIFRVVRTTKEGTLVYNLDRSIKNIPRERLTQELNADNLEVFFADKVLIVEGVSDRLLMRGLIDKFYRGGLEIKVMEAHGKGNMDIYIGLLQRFHIPYVIMLDLDALDAWSQEYLAGQRARKNNREYLIKSLKEQGIYILPYGSIEKHYPRKYQRDDKKPVNALHAVAQITASEYTSAIMSPLREIIEAL